VLDEKKLGFELLPPFLGPPIVVEEEELLLLNVGVGVEEKEEVVWLADGGKAKGSIGGGGKGVDE
jgi:hypothetical protein